MPPLPRPAPLPVLAVLIAAALVAGCGGGDDPGKAAGGADTPSAPDSAFVSVTPTPTPAPSPTATRTGPSGETPQQRRDKLGGCPSAADVGSAGGTPVTAAADPGPTLICAYTSTRTTTFEGSTTPVLQVNVSEPVGLSGDPDLRSYRRTVERNNPAATAPDLGPGAFFSYDPQSPELCAAWFEAEDGKVLTVSVLDLVDRSTEAGVGSVSCTVATTLARGLRG